MNLYVIADLHLSLSENKSMEVFGSRWNDYISKLERAWNATVTPDDTVIIPGDISWGMTPQEALEDFTFLDRLPGRKILGKGNHDYWWQTVTKLTDFCAQNGLSTLSFLYNNAYFEQNALICGSRGWWNEERLGPSDTEYAKIVNREAARLTLSLEAGMRLRHDAEPLVFLHFPPVFRGSVCTEITDILHRFGVRRVWFGHIHSQYDLPPVFVHEDIEYTLVSADYLNFRPLPVDTCRHNTKV